MRKESVVVYEASRADSTLREIFRDLFNSRELMWSFFIRDFRARYEQSLLSYLWILAPPLVTAGLFTFVARRQLLPIEGTELPYPAFVMLGLTLWGMFSGTLSGVMSSLAVASSIVKKLNFPRETLLFAALGQSLVDTAIRCLPLAVVLMWFGGSIKWTIAFVPVVMFFLLIFTLGVGCILSVLNALARDVSSAISIGLQLAMFLTPVVYPAPKSWPFLLINYLNPISPFIIATHDLAGRGSLSMPLPLIVSSLLGCLVLLVGLRIFRLAQPIIGERI
jgi:lipopolysaccharide transport system permease protein